MKAKVALLTSKKLSDITAWFETKVLPPLKREQVLGCGISEDEKDFRGYVIYCEDDNNENNNVINAD